MTSQEEYLDNLLKGIIDTEDDDSQTPTEEEKMDAHQDMEIMGQLDSVEQELSETDNQILSIEESPEETEVSETVIPEEKIALPEEEEEIPETEIPETEVLETVIPEEEIALPEEEEEIPETEIPETEVSETVIPEEEITLPEEEEEIPETEIPETEVLETVIPEEEIALPEEETEVSETEIPEEEITLPEEEEEISETEIPETEIPEEEIALPEEELPSEDEFMDLLKDSGIDESLLQEFESNDFTGEDADSVLQSQEEADGNSGAEETVEETQDEAQDETAEGLDEESADASQTDLQEEVLALSPEESDENVGEEKEGIDSLLNTITEEEIERLLNYGKEAGEESGETSFGDDDLDGDLAELLEKSGDLDLSEINDMLSKADNNVAVDESALSLEESDDEKGAADILNEINQTDQTVSDKDSKKAKKAEEKAKKAEEKARKAEEKKRLKEEAKKEKEAKKAAKKGKKADVEENTDFSFAEMDALLAAGDNEKTDENKVPEPVGITDNPDLTGLDINDSFGTVIGVDNDFQGAEGDDNGEQAISLEEAFLEIKDKNAKPKKKGLLSRLINFLTEEVDDDEKKGNENIQLSDENQGIIDELDKEGDAVKGKKGAKPKKEKKKKEPKPPKPEKPKKQPKPKKEKPPKPQDNRPVKKLPKKKVMILLLFGVTLAAAIILITSFFGDYMIKREAKEAFERGDYQEVFEDLYGRTDLNEREQAMYGKSESILRIRIWLREYEILADEGEEAKALESLIQSVNGFKELYDYAVQFNASQEVVEVYDSIVGILWDKYGLTQEQALDIAAEKNDKDYSRRIYLIIDELNLSDKSRTSGNNAPDPLPEEDDIRNGKFR